MKEFLFLIRNDADHYESMSAEEQKVHVEEASAFVRHLTAEGKFISAQPLTLNGRILSHRDGVFKDGPFVESKEVIGGFFHILAEDLDEALELAKRSRSFESSNMRIEIREIAHVEGIN